MNPAHGRPWQAALYMLAAVLTFAQMDAGLKLLSGHYPPMQVAAIRGAASLQPVLAWALWTGGVTPLLRVRWPLYLLRGVLGVAVMAGFVYALQRADAVALAGAYGTGRGRVTVQAITHLEEMERGRNIIVTELPYLTNKSSLIRTDL